MKIRKYLLSFIALLLLSCSIHAGDIVEDYLIEDNYLEEYGDYDIYSQPIQNDGDLTVEALNISSGMDLDGWLWDSDDYLLQYVSSGTGLQFSTHTTLWGTHELKVQNNSSTDGFFDIYWELVYFVNVAPYGPSSFTSSVSTLPSTAHSFTISVTLPHPSDPDSAEGDYVNKVSYYYNGRPANVITTNSSTTTLSPVTFDRDDEWMEVGQNTFQVFLRDTHNAVTASNIITVTVNKGDPVITTMPTAGGTTYGNPLSSSSLSGGVARNPGGEALSGYFVWENQTSIPDAGSDHFVIFIPYDLETYNQARSAQVMDAGIEKADHDISLTGPSSLSYNSQGTYSASNVVGTLSWNLSAGLTEVSRSGNSITVRATSGTGTATVTASDTGNTNYNSDSSSKSVTLSKINHEISLTGPSTLPYNSQGTYTASNVIGTLSWNLSAGLTEVSRSGNSITVRATSGTGTATVTASDTGNANYSSDSSSKSVTLTKVNHDILLTGSSSLSYNSQGTYSASNVVGTLSWNLSAGLTEVSRSGNSITVRATSGTGTATVTASDTGNTNYNSDSSSKSVTLTKASHNITISGPSTLLYNSQGTYTASNVIGTLSWNLSAGLTEESRSGNSITVTATSGTGTATVTASDTGNTYYYSDSTSKSVTLTKASHDITIGGPSTLPNNNEETYTASNVIGTLSWSLSGDISEVSRSGNTIIVRGDSDSGTATLTASDTGSSNYNADTSTYSITLDEPVDLDSDMMPDYWEIQEIIDDDVYDEITDITDVSPTGDYDGDLVSNIQEYLDGTDPADEYDYLSFAPPTPNRIMPTVQPTAEPSTTPTPPWEMSSMAMALMSLPDVTSPDFIDFFDPMPDDITTDHWYESSWFGWFYAVDGSDWIYSLSLGWLYVIDIDDTSGGMDVFSYTLKYLWIYQGSSVWMYSYNYPSPYKFMLHYPGSYATQWFYIDGLNEWVDKAPTNDPDFNDNNLSDWWELDNFSTMGVLGSADPDGDGRSNFYEEQYGYDPNTYEPPTYDMDADVFSDFVESIAGATGINGFDPTSWIENTDLTSALSSTGYEPVIVVPDKGVLGVDPDDLKLTEISY